MASADWTTGRSAHGPTLAAWLSDQLGDRGAAAVGESFARRLGSWAAGSNASFYTADRWATELGLHVSEAPPEVWRDESAKTH